MTVALKAGLPGERLIVHGNNKSFEELEAAGVANAWLVVVDAPDEVDLAADAKVERVLIRTTLALRRTPIPRSVRPIVDRSSDSRPSKRSRRSDDRGCWPRCRGAPRPYWLAAAGRLRRDRDSRVARGLLGAVSSRARLDAAHRRPRRRTGHSVRPGAHPALDRRVRRHRRLEPRRTVERARVADPAARSRARQVDRRPGGHHTLRDRSREGCDRLDHVRRSRRRHVGQPAAPALRRRVHRDPRKQGRRVTERHLRRLRHALRVRRRLDP